MSVSKTSGTPRAAALIVAAGSGTRFGGALPKVFQPLRGVPLLTWSLRAFAQHAEIGPIVVVASEAYTELAEQLCANELRGDWLVVAGGPERRISVRNGLFALERFAPDLVAIHDGARPLVSQEIITDGLRVCRECGAAVATVCVTDTVKQVDSQGRIQATLDRSCIHLAQTPQTFSYPLIVEAHARAETEGWEVTDDGMLLERFGKCVCASRGEARNLKVTVPEDMALAEWLITSGHVSGPRIGHGYDLHRLTSGRRLMLGGVQIPHDRGLLGHSDADAALHAVCDALLGAAGLGDIGQHFPDTDPAYKDASSSDLTTRVARLIIESGWRIGNVDVTIIAQEPKLAPYIVTMREATARALGITPAQVSFKATTNERLGAIGEGHAIAASAVALIFPSD